MEVWMFRKRQECENYPYSSALTAVNTQHTAMNKWRVVFLCICVYLCTCLCISACLCMFVWMCRRFLATLFFPPPPHPISISMVTMISKNGHCGWGGQQTRRWEWELFPFFVPLSPLPPSLSTLPCPFFWAVLWFVILHHLYPEWTNQISDGYGYGCC